MLSTPKFTRKGKSSRLRRSHPTLRADEMSPLPADLAAIRARLDDARDWVALSKKENGLKIIEKGTLVFNLEKTLREHECLLARLEEMREALEQAIERITSEYCSHPWPHSPTFQTCYAKKQLAALRPLEEPMLRNCPPDAP